MIAIALAYTMRLTVRLQLGARHRCTRCKRWPMAVSAFAQRHGDDPRVHTKYLSQPPPPARSSLVMTEPGGQSGELTARRGHSSEHVLRRDAQACSANGVELFPPQSALIATGDAG